MKEAFVQRELEHYLKRTQQLMQPGALVECARDALLMLLCAQSARLYLRRGRSLSEVVPLASGGCRLEQAPEMIPRPPQGQMQFQLEESGGHLLCAFLALEEPLGAQNSALGEAPGFWYIKGMAAPMDDDSACAAIQVCGHLRLRLKSLLSEVVHSAQYTDEQQLSGQDLLPSGALEVLAHQLSTPLSGVLSGVRVLRYALHGLHSRQKEMDIPMCTRLLDAMEKDLYEALRTASNVLEAGCMEEGEGFGAPQYFSASSCIEGLALDIEPYAQANKVALQVRGVRKSDFMLYTDRRALERILMNLLGNALKYCHEEKGKVMLAVRRVRDSAVFTVTDNGCGIRPEDLPHVFEKFWRTNNGGRDGVGLGLYLAHELAHRLGGALRVKNGPNGTGARFELRVPLRMSLSKSEPQEDVLELRAPEAVWYDTGERRERVRREMAALEEWPQEPSEPDPV